jgi:lipopolysaccharide transport system permease protein
MNFVFAPIGLALENRHLLKTFIVKDIKGRFEGSVAGTLWALIHPLAQILVYLAVFSIVLRVQVTARETGTDSYAVFFLSGMFPWLLLAETLSRSVGSLVDNAELITKVVFPVELIPLSRVLSSFVLNGVGMVLLLGFIVFKGYFSASWILLAILVPLQMLFAWGLASLLAAFCVFIRDIRELLGIGLMVWFFVTPILYPISMTPEALRPYMFLNPMSGFTVLYRQALLLHMWDWATLVQVGLISVVLYGLGSWFFRRAKPAFGDVL